MSPVFRHGRLRLYLLKLLDEAPRHGYEVIRLLQDRFLGVYAPSPGTIYPRLARLEEEGLVTHDEVDGKKVYRITDKGREEIQARLDDLAELEEELTESVRDIAREVTQDVRDTVRNLREELTWTTRDVRREEREQERDAARDRARRIREEIKESARQARSAAWSGRPQAGDQDAGTGAGHSWEASPHVSPGGPQPEADGPGRADGPGPAEGPGRADDAPGATGAADIPWGASGRGSNRKREQRRGSRMDWPDWAAFQDWQSWAGWRERPGRRGWAGLGSFPGSAGPGGPEAPDSEATGAESPGRPGPGFRTGRGRSAGLDAGLFRDLERLAVEFARELRTAAWHTESVGENALSDLRTILEDTLTKVKDEVFGAAATGTGTAARTRRADAGPADSAKPPTADHSGASHSGASGGGASGTSRRGADEAGPGGADPGGAGPGEAGPGEASPGEASAGDAGAGGEEGSAATQDESPGR
jgi:DNA-binding PadR family transcriptional regulator